VPVPGADTDPAPGGTATLARPAEQLRERLQTGRWTAAVHGLGYVGLPLAVAMADRGIPVIGFDVSPARVDGLAGGHSHVEDVPDETLQRLLAAGAIRFTSTVADTTVADVVIIAVPTPNTPDGEPDMSFILSATENVARVARPGQLVSLESTTYPGTTREVIGGALRRVGLVPGEDVFVVYSPERINPGDTAYDLTRIPKVVGGLDPVATELGSLAYDAFVTSVRPVESPEVAEMTKLLENIFRAVNIALANEMAMLCSDLGIDVWDVVDSAATKPFGYMPHYPGPGVGGHCIPVDPAYLLYRARQVASPHTQLLEIATRVNDGMPDYVVERLRAGLERDGRDLGRSRVLVLGAAYKPGTSDLRESPALRVLELLAARAAGVAYHDPLVAEVRAPAMSSQALTPELLAWADAVVLVTDQPGTDLDAVFASGRYVLDSRDAFRRRGLAGPHIEPL